MKRTVRLLLVCLIFALLATSHNALAAKKKAVAVPDAAQPVAAQASTAVADQAGAATTAVTNQAGAATTAVANQANAAATAVTNQASTTTAVTNQVSAATTTQKTSQIVRLNSATADQLTQVRGIGPKTAKDIIDKRTELGGKFTSIDQLLQVKGIKQKRLEKMKPFLAL